MGLPTGWRSRRINVERVNMHRLLCADHTELEMVRAVEATTYTVVAPPPIMCC